MIEVIFLGLLALIWMCFASIQDIKSTIISDWISFSLIIFALSFRFFYGLFIEENFMFFYQGLIGLCIFVILGNIFYFSKLFAGGDLKLMIALGTILPFSNNFSMNIKIFILFFFLFFLISAFYGFFWSFILAFKNLNSFKKEFKFLFNDNLKKIYSVMILGLFIMVIGFFQKIFFLVGSFIIFLVYLYLFIKSVDESCMVKKISPKELIEGDWLYEDVKVGKKMVKSSWEGLSKSDIKLFLHQSKKIKVRYGIPFVPVFFITLLVLFYLLFFYGGIWVLLYP